MAYWSGALVVGFVVSLLFGHLLAGGMRKVLYELSGIKDPPDHIKRVENWLIGLVERTFFTVLVFLVAHFAPARLVDLLTPALVWIGLKMATHWQPSMATTWSEEDKNAGVPATAAMIAILSGLVSLTVAGLGGFIAAVIVKASQ